MTSRKLAAGAAGLALIAAGGGAAVSASGADTAQAPDTAVVKVSAVCTPAEAAAGGTPMLSSMVLEIWP